MLPDFIIVGAQRSGTTTLFDALSRHPQVVRATAKELHFFDLRFRRGIAWYERQFPAVPDSACLAGEATPYYLFHPAAALRCAHTLPAVKIVAILRNPVDRAYSHYHHEVGGGYECLTFEQAIQAEPVRVGPDPLAIVLPGRRRLHAHQHFAYLARGRYAEQLGRWQRLVSADRMHVILMEDLVDSPLDVYERLVEFLGLPQWMPREVPIRNQGSYPPMQTRTRRRLDRLFREPNRALAEMIQTHWPGADGDFRGWSL